MEWFVHVILLCQFFYNSNCQSSCSSCTDYGACLEKSGSTCASCICPKDFSGDCCETEPDACSLNPCTTLSNEHWNCTNLGHGQRDCKCQEGFTGAKCDTAMSICDTVTCYNGGTCILAANNATSCNCSKSFEGKSCETYKPCSGYGCTRDCSKNPCKNGGICYVKNDSKTYCDCPDGYKDANCSTKICGSLTCQHGGKCVVDSAGKEVCQCLNIWTGTNCQTFDGCKFWTCENGGTCYVNGTDNVPKCSCLKGWNGKHCENETNNCNPNPCIYEEFGVKNATTCTSSVGDYTCDCPTGTTGKNCSDNIDDCKRSGTGKKDNLCNTVDKSANCSDGLDEYKCLCSAAYTGDKCEIYDACFNVTCANGGTCSTVNNKFKCDCVVGYTGDKCQILTDNCKPNPCVFEEYGVKKNATCTNKVANYTCVCPSGTSGNNCEINPDDCILNGTSVCNTIDSEATCLDGLDAYKCKCGQEYEGDQCTIYNACFNVTCLNGATCTTTADMQPLCTCAKGYTGTLCETVVNNCNPNPCIYVEHEETKTAICTTLIGDYKCSCPAGTTGKNCSTNPNECLPTASGGNVCNKVDLNATCSDGLNNYTCTCTDEYKGAQCQTYDACVYNHCENGNCSTVGQDFKCTCTKGWEGRYCEIMTDNCSPNPCIYEEWGVKNETTCTNLLGDYYCECPLGSTGKNCTNNTDECQRSGRQLLDNICNTIDKKATCSDGLNEFRCTCSAEYTGPQCKMTVIVWKVAQLFGGIDDITNLLEEVVKTPNLIKDLVPFLLGQQPRENQSAMSWSFDELFLWASYEKNELNYQKDFTLTFDTTLGNCYTFNNGNCSRRWSSRKSGRKGGFQALMKVQQLNYLAWIDTSSLVVFVHPPDESIFAESVRYQAAPNTSTSIITQRNAYSRLSGKYGTCVKSLSEVGNYYYAGNYTTAGCFRGCYQDAVYEECGCMDPRYAMPEEMSACNMSVWNCVKGITDERGDASNWKDCKCPSPCSESQFDSAFAKSSFPSYYFGCEGLKSDATKYKYCMGNYSDMVYVSVYVPRLTRKVFAEVPAMSLTQFLSNVGGIAGLFIGFSMVTIFDFSFIFIWIGWVLCRKGEEKNE